jgi:hypothetical protein
VIAYDSRAHGESGGDACTYGFFEKEDLRRVLDVDTDTRPDHSQRVMAALAGPKQLMLIPDARHNQSLGGDVWSEIERWIDDVLGDRH